MKKFLLFLFSEPFLYVLCPFAVLGVLFIAVSFSTTSGLVASGRVAPTMLIFLAWVIIGIVLMFIATQKAKKHTILELGPDQLVLVHRGEGKDPIFYKDPLWGKYRVNLVNFPENWGSKVVNGMKRVLKVTADIGTKPVTVSLPLTFEFQFSGPYQALDFQNILENPALAELEDGSEAINVGKRLEQILLKRLEGDEGRKIVANYLNGECNLDQFTTQLSRLISVRKDEMLSNIDWIQVFIHSTKLTFSWAALG